MHDSLLLYYQNVGGMNTSIAEYYLACSDASYDFIALTETWLNSNTLSKQIFGHFYTVYRQDRSVVNSNKLTGGGVLLSINSKFKTRELIPPNGQTTEQVWVSVPLCNHTMFIGVSYIPPDQINEPIVIDQHVSSIIWITEQMKPNDAVLLIGDFNLPGIRWVLNTSKYLHPDTRHSSMNSLAEHLIDSFSFARLCQMNGVLNSNNRILDLCFVSSDIMHNTTVIESPSPLVKSCHHHPPLLVSLYVPPPLIFTCSAESICYNYSKADFLSMNSFFESVNWSEMLNIHDIELAALSITNVLLYAIDQFVPMKKNVVTRHLP